MFSFYSGPRIWCLRDVDFLPVGSFEFCSFPVGILTSSGVGFGGLWEEPAGCWFTRNHRGGHLASSEPGQGPQGPHCRWRAVLHKQTLWSIMSAQAMRRNLWKCALVTWNQQGEELFFDSFSFLSLPEMICDRAMWNTIHILLKYICNKHLGARQRATLCIEGEQEDIPPAWTLNSGLEGGFVVSHEAW